MVSSRERASLAWVPSWYSQKLTSSGQPYVTLPAKANRPPLFITPIYDADATALVEIMALDEVNDRLISIPKPYTMDDSKWWISFQQSLPRDGPMLLHVIRAGDPETGAFQGAVSLAPRSSSTRDDQVPKRDGECELGYYLHPDLHGQGVMKDAVLGLVAWAATERDVKDVIVMATIDNAASAKVITSFEGFQRIGDVFDLDWPDAKGGGKKQIRAWRWELTA